MPGSRASRADDGDESSLHPAFETEQQGKRIGVPLFVDFPYPLTAVRTGEENVAGNHISGRSLNHAPHLRTGWQHRGKASVADDAIGQERRRSLRRRERRVSAFA